MQMNNMLDILICSNPNTDKNKSTLMNLIQLRRYNPTIVESLVGNSTLFQTNITDNL